MIDGGDSLTDNTALCVSSENGHLDIVKYLVENGADINKYSYHLNNEDNVTCLASENGHLEIVKYLVENGA